MGLAFLQRSGLGQPRWWRALSVIELRSMDQWNQNLWRTEMFDLVGNRGKSAVRYLLLGASVVLLPLAACNKPAAPSETGPKTFATPEDAGKTLADATKAEDKDAVLQIFGPGSADVVSSGDPADDKASMEAFSRDYQTMHRWRKLG